MVLYIMVVLQDTRCRKPSQQDHEITLTRYIFSAGNVYPALFKENIVVETTGIKCDQTYYIGARQKNETFCGPGPEELRRYGLCGTNCKFHRNLRGAPSKHTHDTVRPRL